MKKGDMVVTRDGLGTVIDFYGNQIMVHVRYGKRYTAYRMFHKDEVKPA